jgi:hypothetical protein
MLKARWPAVFLAVLVLSSLYGMTISWERHANDFRTEKPKRNSIVDNVEIPSWSWLSHDAAGFFTFWLVIVGGFQALLFYYQLRLIRKSLLDTREAAEAAKDSALAASNSVALAERTAQRQLRAYITVEIGSGCNQGGKRKLFFEFRPVIKNVGQTPAYDVEVISKVSVMPLPIPADYNFSLVPSPIKSVMTLGPQQNRFTAVVLGKKLSLSELREIRNAKNKAIHVYGTVTYRDVFDVWRHTNYCYSIYFWHRRAPTWNATELHNDSD